MAAVEAHPPTSPRAKTGTSKCDHNCLPACLPACLIFAAWVAEPALAQAPPFETPPLLIQWVNPQNMGPVFNGQTMGTGFPSLDYALDPTTNSALLPGVWAPLSIELRLLGNEVYVPNGTITFPAPSGDPRHAAFALPAEILRVSGGWTGAPGEIRPAGRPSTLSGDRGVPGVPTDNCYHVVVPFRSSYSVERDSQWLDFLIVEGGYANGSPMTLDGLGGGILSAGGQMRLTEVTVRDCYAEFGGGICSIQAVSTETGLLVSPGLWAWRSTFRDCFAAQDGAALYVDRCRRVVLTNVVCRNNTAGRDGGAIWVGSRIPDHEIVNSVFHDNNASQRGGAIYVSDHSNGPAGLRILNCTIAYNSLNEDAGGPGGAGVYLEFDSGGVPIPPNQVLSRTVFTNTILFANPGLSNDDNILLASPPSGSHLVDVSNCFIGGRTTNPNTGLTVGTQGYGVAFIDAGQTGEVPGWVQAATRDFRLQVTSRCINQGTDLVFLNNSAGNDWMDLDGDRFYFEALDPTTGLFYREELCREHFMGDEAWLGGNVSTREVRVPGSGSPTLPDIGQDGGQVNNAITDIGAFEYRIYQIGV